MSTSKGLAPEHAKAALKRANAVAFDVDSTVCKEEAIDVLADFLGQGKAVAELTAK
jgi:phosphoserine phosphatase